MSGLRKAKQEYMRTHNTTTYNDLLNDSNVRHKLDEMTKSLKLKLSTAVSIRINLNNIK